MIHPSSSLSRSARIPTRVFRSVAVLYVVSTPVLSRPRTGPGASPRGRQPPLAFPAARHPPRRDHVKDSEPAGGDSVERNQPQVSAGSSSACPCFSCPLRVKSVPPATRLRIDLEPALIPDGLGALSFTLAWISCCDQTGDGWAFLISSA